jgi:hypothetical protein
VDVIDAGDRVVVTVRTAAQTGRQAEPRANLATFRDWKVIGITSYETPAKL